MDWLIWFAVVVVASLGVICLVSVGVEWALTRVVRTLSSSDLAVVTELLCRDLDGQNDPATPTEKKEH